MLFKVACAQNRLDSFVTKFLIDKKQIDKAINTKTKVKEGEFVTKANYFLLKKPAIRLSDSVSLQPVIFGCYTSHAPKYLLIEHKMRSTSVFYVYGEDRLLQEINKLRQEILKGEKISWNDDDVAALINYLSLCYL